ncbi:MAG: cupin domain-containing protein [Desulfopila sp.]|jgi:mannose-6-phosphate isomerase-like protein (cupin superfamily)|nr:cupin domain-containing protein [Desulfopila sp.]
MKMEIKRQAAQPEYWFREGCHIIETANDGGDTTLSVARARVESGVTTAWHRLDGREERYLIISGCGVVELGEEFRGEVAAGDVVRIPAGTRQRISNTGKDDLIFFAVCTPPFVEESYAAEENFGEK